MPDPKRDYLTLLLNPVLVRASVALWRAVELRTLYRDIRPSVLDLGCGDGLIAQVLFENEGSGGIGVRSLADAGPQGSDNRGLSSACSKALGHAMPYPGGTFGSVLSNSVLEHIPDLDPVLREAARVLRPGGRVFFTVPSDAFRRLLSGYQDRAKAGDPAGAEAYAAGVDA